MCKMRISPRGGAGTPKSKIKTPCPFTAPQSSARVVDVDSVPATEWDAIAKFGLEAVWLMGLWEPPGRHHDLKSKPGFSGRFPRARPDFRPEDNMGLVAYPVRCYAVGPTLAARRGWPLRAVELARRGMRLILCHRSSIRECPDDARDDSAGFVPIEGRVYMYRRDPYFHIDRASGAFHLTPAVRQTVLPVRSSQPPVAIETGQIGNFSARVDTNRAYPATRPYSKHPTRAASCAIILANSGHASLSVSIV
jgi:hypothetical protein